MKINKVSIVIETTDDEFASVRLVTEPVPEDADDIEDTPAVLLGSSIWNVVQEFIEMNRGETRSIQ
jgi:hypothetical protein